jgi:transposase-like protein
MYGSDISDSTISGITDKILPVMKEWQMGREIPEDRRIVALALAGAFDALQICP